VRNTSPIEELFNNDLLFYLSNDFLPLYGIDLCIHEIFLLSGTNDTKKNLASPSLLGYVTRRYPIPEASHITRSSF
jgi:hypothetical protein